MTNKKVWQNSTIADFLNINVLVKIADSVKINQVQSMENITEEEVCSKMERRVEGEEF